MFIEGLLCAMDILSIGALSSNRRDYWFLFCRLSEHLGTIGVRSPQENMVSSISQPQQAPSTWRGSLLCRLLEDTSILRNGTTPLMTKFAVASEQLKSNPWYSEKETAFCFSCAKFLKEPWESGEMMTWHSIYRPWIQSPAATPHKMKPLYKEIKQCNFPKLLAWELRLWNNRSFSPVFLTDQASQLCHNRLP